MVNRLNISLNQNDYNTEVNTIKYIAQENYNDHQLIEFLIKMQNFKPITKETSTEERKKQHNTNLSQQIQTIQFKNSNTTNNTLQRHVTNKTHITPSKKNTSTSVYRIKCRLMTVPYSTSIKQVDLSKHDILNK